MPYRIYTRVNYADTSRDPDDIHIEELCYKKTKKDMLKFCEEYIKENFSNPSEFCRDQDKNQNLSDKIQNKFKEEHKESYSAVDICSYGKTIIAEKITIE